VDAQDSDRIWREGIVVNLKASTTVSYQSTPRRHCVHVQTHRICVSVRTRQRTETFFNHAHRIMN
jgi:hypothetical protein